jgi:lipoyl-dependent peroxiredoxin
METLYTAIAHATGGGRDGHVRSDNDRLDFETRPPKEIGGSGEGTNPEELFAAGYAACFLGALHAAGKQVGVDTKDASVSASVRLNNDPDDGFTIAVDLDVFAPNASADDARKAANIAHEDICPYSKATRGNVSVGISIVS